MGNSAFLPLKKTNKNSLLFIILPMSNNDRSYLWWKNPPAARFGIAPRRKSSQVDGDGREESLRSRTTTTTTPTIIIIIITARLSRELEITG